jgi:predicted acetyltransferase
MPATVRPITDAEIPAFFEAMSTAFLDRPDVEKAAADVRPLWDLTRAFAAFDNGRLVGTFRTWATEVTVPGGVQLPASAVTNVTVVPTHRRRGILRAMAAAEHGAARERGEVLALLYAAEYPIYGRFGYGPSCRGATWTLETRNTAFIPPRAPGSGVELVTPTADTRDLVRGVYEHWRTRQPGEIRRRDYRWDFDLGLREDAFGPRWKGFVALHRDGDGTVDGYVRYRAEEKWEQNQAKGTITVDELPALTDAAYDDLWRFLGEIDLVVKVTAGFRRPAERLPWLLANGRAASVTEITDGMWTCLLDVRAALAGRRYERSDALVLEVVGSDGTDATSAPRRIRLDATPDGASAAVTTVSPDLTLRAAALGAAYLGGAPLRWAALREGVDEHTTGALARADALFRTADEPWCSTFF